MKKLAKKSGLSHNKFFEYYFKNTALEINCDLSHFYEPI